MYLGKHFPSHITKLLRLGCIYIMALFYEAVKQEYVTYEEFHRYNTEWKHNTLIHAALKVATATHI